MRRRWLTGSLGGALAFCGLTAAMLTALGPWAISSVDSAPSLAPVSDAHASPRSSDRTVTQVASAGDDDLLVVGQGALAPIEAASLLFPRPGDSVRSLIMTSASANNLPYDFFFRLLHQESGLNPNAVSPAGALGIAQFMPGTAFERGLRNPFDPNEAIPKSAELLREHQARFGNLGLAAAAYNAGPRRVMDWLSGRSGMPAETRDYVLRITGRAIETWAPAGRPVIGGIGPAFFAAQGAGLFAPLPAMTHRAVSTPREAVRHLDAVARNERQTKKLDARTKSIRSEQALCAALNSEGQMCLVQAVY